MSEERLNALERRIKELERGHLELLQGQKKLADYLLRAFNVLTELRGDLQQAIEALRFEENS